MIVHKIIRFYGFEKRTFWELFYRGDINLLQTKKFSVSQSALFKK